MAYIIPSDVSRLALAGGHTAELQTLALLRRSLPNDYTVFHGVHWTREYHGWTHFGEIDFVVVNKSGRVMFIEQKNGVIDESPAGLVKHYGDEAKNVATQLHRSIDKVRDKFQWQHGRSRRLEVDYMIYLPDYQVRNLNAAGMDRQRVVDSADRDGLAARIEGTLGAGSAANDGWYDRVHEFFCQTFEVVPNIHAHASAHERSFARQAGPIATLLANLEMSPFQLRVQGAAGSGKSLLAREFVGVRAGLGSRVLMLCYNRPLAERLRNSLNGLGVVNTWFGFCHTFLESRGQAVDFSGKTTGPEFWHAIQERVMAEPIPDNWLFDTLVVDEGQDFEQEWFEIMRLFLRDGGAILWLEDPDQNLQNKASIALPGFVTFRCRANYRSPESIARFIRKTLTVEFEPANPLPGLGVGIHTYEDPAEQAPCAAKVLRDLVSLGFSNDDIVMLTCRGGQNSIFSGLSVVGGTQLRRFTGEYVNGQQVMTAGQLTFDSVNRYKGQESAAVVLVDVDPRMDRLEQDLRVLFCGMTRATIRLELLVRKGNPENARFLD